MNASSRHKACKLCRERKVRCDGDQPACEKCQRLGETCVYTPTYKPTRADLAQTIETLQERVDSAEAYIRQQNQNQSIKPNNHQLNSAPDSAVSVDCSSPGEALPSLTRNAVPSAHYQNQRMTQFQDSFDNDFMNCLPNSPMTIRNDAPHFQVEEATLNVLSSTHYQQHQCMAQFEDSLDTDFMNCLASPRMGIRNDAPRFQVEELTPPEEPLGDSLPLPQEGSGYRHMQMPSLQEIRALNSSSSSLTSLLANSKAEKGEQNDDCSKILAELTTFSSAIFTTHAEMAGISSVVAEYLAWIRKSSPGAGSMVSSTPNFMSVLETLETRVRELHDMAETTQRTAWKRTTSSLSNIDGARINLTVFEAEMQKRAADMAQFFCNNYDVCSAMPEQRQGLQKKI